MSSTSPGAIPSSLPTFPSSSSLPLISFSALLCLLESLICCFMASLVSKLFPHWHFTSLALVASPCLFVLAGALAAGAFLAPEARIDTSLAIGELQLLGGGRPVKGWAGESMKCCARLRASGNNLSHVVHRAADTVVPRLDCGLGARRRGIVGRRRGGIWKTKIDRYACDGEMESGEGRRIISMGGVQPLSGDRPHCSSGAPNVARR